MVHRILVGKRFKWFGPKSDRRVWPGRLGSSLNVHKSVPESHSLWSVMALNIHDARQEAVFPRGLLLKAYSMDQQHRHHLEACYTCRIAGSTPNLPLNQICILTKSPAMQMHMQVWEATVIVERLWSWADLGSNPNSATYLTKFWASIFSPEKGGNTTYLKRIIVKIQCVNI